MIMYDNDNTYGIPKSEVEVGYLVELENPRTNSMKIKKVIGEYTKTAYLEQTSRNRIISNDRFILVGVKDGYVLLPNEYKKITLEECIEEVNTYNYNDRYDIAEMLHSYLGCEFVDTDSYRSNKVKQIPEKTIFGALGLGSHEWSIQPTDTLPAKVIKSEFLNRIPIPKKSEWVDMYDCNEKEKYITIITKGDYTLFLVYLNKYERISITVNQYLIKEAKEKNTPVKTLLNP